MKRRPPPLRHCRDCGCALRSWREAPLCGDCVRLLDATRPLETLREARRRIHGGGGGA